VYWSGKRVNVMNSAVLPKNFYEADVELPLRMARPFKGPDNGNKSGSLDA